MTDYRQLSEKLLALIKDVPYITANLANASALLYGTLDGINWAGFYLLKGDRLILGPFQGKPACIEIPIGKGVCGTAARKRETVTVGNVHLFPGHIACDGASNSEIVIPLFNQKHELMGVLDIDSPEFDRFDANDRAGLEKFAEILSKQIFNT